MLQLRGMICWKLMLHYWMAQACDDVRIVGAVAKVVSFGELEGVAPVCLDNDARAKKF